MGAPLTLDEWLWFEKRTRQSEISHSILQGMCMNSDQVRTTIVLELQGKLVYASSKNTSEELEAAMQAERLIDLELDGKKIKVQGGSIEYLMDGDQRPKKDDGPGPPA